MSLCTSLKGHLKSCFLVLSDDRVLPPYQGKKRSHPDGDQVNVSGKRTHQDSLSASRVVPSTSGVAGVTPLVSYQAINTGISGPMISVPATQQSFGFSGFSTGPPGPPGVLQAVPAHGMMSHPSLMPPNVGYVSVSAPSQMISSAMMQYPPPSQAQPQTQIQVLASPVEQVTASPAFTKVVSRRSRGKGKSSAASATTVTRPTPPRAAKKVGTTSVPVPSDVKSPGDQYESCGSVTEEEAPDQMVQE